MASMDQESAAGCHHAELVLFPISGQPCHRAGRDVLASLVPLAEQNTLDNISGHGAGPIGAEITVTAWTLHCFTALHMACAGLQKLPQKQALRFGRMITTFRGSI